ncbi:Double Clp-N motif-containing P-loop nucleoside triphosphate hydrolases superfamily protein [Perilla frutescens var. hirtella]|nr:Double Clp-N motif-containing P-loop nucleoside triphosphate hydrolases superfamily protein [Perilla frutescens var. hirtella]
MRAGLSTIQQTLTPEAASVLNLSIAEASRRNHGQTTPLHVAATLLSSPSGFLRQACIRSHPNSSHPLQCRALELCFSVALERLPTAQNMEGSGIEPPISNALMAALKRAQAHQRRGCPEQQQQPLLAVKVELEQLIISILDDPSVSRVMREASFSSPAVKSAIEQSLNSSNPHQHQHHVASGNVNFGGIGPRLVPNPAQLPSQIGPLPNRNVYSNPRLQQGAGAAGNPKGDELNKVLEIMSRSKKKNPILVGDSEPEGVVKELLRKIVNKEVGGDMNLQNVEVVSMEKGILLSDKNEIAAKMEELGGLIESRIRNGGVILDLGDLKWLVEQQQKQQAVSETGRAAVVEMKKLLERFSEGSNKLWLIGTATCETYLRCQVYHSSVENDWDLQAMPIASRSPLLLSNPMESLKTAVTIPSPPAHKSSLCPQCSENYDKELAKLAAIGKSFSEANKQAMQPSLPAWLQNAKLNPTDAKTKDESQAKDQGLLSKHKTQELHKKWRDTCLNLHPNFHQNTRSDRAGPPPLSIATLYNPNPNLLSRSPFHPKLQTAKPLGAALQLNTNQVPSKPAELANSSPKSPVRTDLNLGWKGLGGIPEKATEDQAKDLLGCISSEPQTKLLDKFSNALDADTYKKLLKGLMEKAWWQAEAASAVASAITRCRLGNGKRRGAGSRGDIWLLFTGPDRVGKKKMASVLAEQIFGVSPIMICLGKRRDDEESDMNFRGKTAIDRIAEAVRRNPFLVIMLEDIDEADMLVRGSIKRAIERGRLTDSHGREVGLGNAIFIVTGDWSTTNPDAVRDGRFVDEKKLASVASGGWQLGLIVREKSAKRRANWLQDEDRPLKPPRREMGAALSLDLNLSAAAFVDDEKTDGSNNSSDLTIDHEDEVGLVDGQFSITSVPHDLVSNVDDAIVFKPVNSAFVRREIKKTISVKFSMAVDEKVSIEVEDDVLEKILGGLWHDRSSLEEWIEKVLAPSFDQLKTRLTSPSGDRSNSVVRLVVESDSSSRGKSSGNAEWLPSSILV